MGKEKIARCQPRALKLGQMLSLGLLKAKDMQVGQRIGDWMPGATYLLERADVPVPAVDLAGDEESEAGTAAAEGEAGVEARGNGKGKGQRRRRSEDGGGGGKQEVDDDDEGEVEVLEVKVQRGAGDGGGAPGSPSKRPRQRQPQQHELQQRPRELVSLLDDEDDSQARLEAAASAAAAAVNEAAPAAAAAASSSARLEEGAQARGAPLSSPPPAAPAAAAAAAPAPGWVENLFCPVCRELVATACHLACAHAVCFTCIHRYWVHSMVDDGKYRRCPDCRAAITQVSRSCFVDNRRRWPRQRSRPRTSRTGRISARTGWRWMRGTGTSSRGTPAGWR